MKKLTVFLLLISLVAAVAGCSPSQPAGDSTQGTSSAPVNSSVPTSSSTAPADIAPPSGAYSLPLTNDPVTFRYMTDENPTEYKSITSHLPITAEIERLTGITFEFEAIPNSDYATVFTTRMAAGTDLPDFCSVSGGTATVYEFGLNGALVNMKPFVDKYDTYLETVMDAEPGIIPYFTYPDGGIYTYRSVNSGTDIADPYGWMIRRDWLEALSLEAPTNITEWEIVMDGFRNGDPNQNGEKDEIPWCPRPGLAQLYVWGTMWGIPHRSNGWRLVGDTVEYAWITEDARSMFTWLADCYAKEYLDPEFLSLDHNARVANDVAGAFVRFANNLPAFNQRAQEGGSPNAYYMGIAAPKGPDGRGGMDAYGPVSSDEFIGITSACADPDLAFRLIDWIWGSEAGTTLLWFGIEGEHWNAEDSPRNEPNYLGEFFVNNPDGFTSHENALISIGGHAFMPSVRGTSDYWARFADAKLEAASDQLAEGINNMAPSIIPQFPELISTADEADQVRAIQADINTYFSEQAAAFITGTRPMSEWDDFVGEIKSMGIDEWVAIRQQQYDRVK